MNLKPISSPVQTQCVSSIGNLAYSIEEIREQFFKFTSVIESVFVVYDEETLDFVGVVYDE